jgi:ABC-type branched-subunit amino acid transport system ATPase component
VLVTGEVVLTGPCAELRSDPRIREAYLGENIQA